MFQVTVCRMQPATHRYVYSVYVCCVCTWRQSVSHAEWWCTSDDIACAAHVAAHVLHGC